MGAPAKFLFDNDFGASERRKSTVPLNEHATRLADAEAAGYRKGIAAAKAETAQQAADALRSIALTLEQLGRGLAAVEARLETEAVEVAVAAARKLAPVLIAREPLAEIAALVTDCVTHLVAAPHVVVRVNAAIDQAAREGLDAIIRAAGFDGRLVVLAEPDIAPGDCRIEWADGGVRRELAATEGAIDEAVSRYVAGRRGETYMPEVSWRVER